MLSLILSLLACDPAPPEPAAPAPAPGLYGINSPMPGAAAATGALTGIVVENLAAGPYTYTRATLADGTEAWAAATGTPPAVGATVTIATSLPMRDFHSEALDRDFPLVYFVSSYGGDAELTVPTTGAALPPGHPDVAAPAAGAPGAPHPGDPVVGKAPVTPAGTRKVADVWAQRASLGGREVTLSGEVVKSTTAVMGRNWLHIRDGSGAEGTNDLTVTTSGTAAIGDHVQITGVVALDQDFGAGYSYPVLITDASVLVAPAN
jgi:hypothetical protein